MVHPVQTQEGKWIGSLWGVISVPEVGRIFHRVFNSYHDFGDLSNLEWHLLKQNGEAILDSHLEEEGHANLKSLGVPSAWLVESGTAGYTEEVHRRRQVPMLTGYARTQGVRELPGLHWNILVRGDQRDVLQGIRGFEVTFGLAGVFLVLPLIGSLFYIFRRFRKSKSETDHLFSLQSALMTAIGKSHGIMEMRMDGTIMTANDNILQILGYSLGEIQGHHYRMLLDSEFVDKPDYQEFRAKLNRGEFDSGVYKPLGKGGREVWIQSTYNPVFEANGIPCKVFKFTTDIMPQKQMEETIKRLFRENQLILQSAGEGIYGLDTQGHVTFVNSMGANTLGYTPEELMGRPIHATVHHTNAEGFPYALEECPMHTALPKGKPDFVIDEVFWRKDGTSLPVECTSIPIWDGETLVGAVVTFRDISFRRKVELELRQHREHLQELVAQRTRDLNVAKENAERANQAKSGFLSSMSHELRTPMHAILSFAGIAGEKLGAVPPDKISHNLARIRDSGHRLLGLLDDLLDLSKLESGKMSFLMREEDLGSLVKRVMGECEFLALAKGIAVHLQESPGSSTVQCDPEKIGRVVLNVLSNAIRFSPQGGNITIVLRPESLPCGRRKGDSGSKPGMAIIVVDEGVGIPEEELEAVFDKFLQSSKTKTGAGGTGLGLTICKEIVAAHGGRIWAQNRPEGGAVFTVILPLQQLRSPYPTKEISDARRPTEFASCR